MQTTRGLLGVLGMVFGLVGLAAPAAAQQCEWSALDSGLNGPAFALAVFDDGTGPALYAGGNFSMAGGVPAKGIAKWDGTQWSPLAREPNGAVYALTVFDDGTGPALYAGGFITRAGGVPVNNIAKWDGTQWSALGSGMTGGLTTVFALTVFDDGMGPALFAGGTFLRAGGALVNNIAKWDGTEWSALGGGVTGPAPRVDALTVFDDGTGLALYAGGGFSMAGGMPANRIAKWDGAQWSGLSFGMSSGTVLALTVFHDGTGPALYAGGAFSMAGGEPVNNIAKWDGKQWAPLGSGMSTTVSALAVFDDGTGPALYAGGGFTTAGGVEANRIARWDGSQWSALGSGMTGGPLSGLDALTVFDDGTGAALYAGGTFTMAGDVPADRIAKWLCVMP